MLWSQFLDGNLGPIRKLARASHRLMVLACIGQGSNGSYVTLLRRFLERSLLLLFFDFLILTQSSILAASASVSDDDELAGILMLILS